MKKSSVRFAIAVALLLAVGVAGCQSMRSYPEAKGTESSTGLRPDERARSLYISVIEQLIQQKKYRAALAHLDEYERMYKASPVLHRLRGDAWLALGDHANAEREYLEIAEGTLAAYGKHGLGRIEAARQSWSSASAYFREAVREQPTNVRFLNDLGCALFEMGDVEQAEFQLRKALELAPDDEMVKGNLATLRLNGTTAELSDK